jgi:hypothetical protein
VLSLVALIASCSTPAPSEPTTRYSSEVATSWFDLYLDLVQATPGYSPPVASRFFGYAGVTLYEAVVPGMPNYQSLAGQLNGLTALPQPMPGEAYHWPAVANSALATFARRVFATAPKEYLAGINSLEAQFIYQFQRTVAPETLSRSIGQGQLVAYAVYDWSLYDEGLKGHLRGFPASYLPPSGPGKWVPTPPRFQPALLPYWGANRPFVLAAPDECAPAPPPDYSEDPASAFYAEAREVYDAVNTLTPGEKAIALFWADDPGQTPTPPGHSLSILGQVLKSKSSRLDVAAEAYAKLGMAVADAFIACWNTKYQYNLIRPVSYIQDVIDSDWQPLINTPPFPEYTSGHSAQSGAAAQVLTDLFGGDFAFIDHTHDKRGHEARSFASFFDFAEEAAISRLYAGIHYRAAIENGLEQGKCIGRKVSALPFRK